MSEKNRKAIILYLVFVLGYSYLFGVLELIFKNGVFYDFLGKSFTFVPVITALVLNKKMAKNTGGYMSLKVWKNPKALAASAFAPGILISMGAVLYFLVFPNEYSGVFAMGNLFETGENKAISNPLLFVLICIFISAVFSRYTCLNSEKKSAGEVIFCGNRKRYTENQKP